MDNFAIYSLRLGPGRLGISPLPGAGGAYAADLKTVQDWRPDLVISMTTSSEMKNLGAAAFGVDLERLGVEWAHLPVQDFGAPDARIQAIWPDVSQRARAFLSGDGGILVHCRGGCGRSGMVALRLMTDSGLPADTALQMLRTVRPCAVETEAQMVWATSAARTGS
ncbi:protein-tyrosine phosphatase family protein [Ruegeria lacuscaerulensis]|uniref:protein-tyrosine phosphatase family protein n=1 Tax=Ruegeria lacuscaerulensis TaxID=55218 RepID=UPI00147DC111|nr:dual specificity protein phosphatase family protein [Ruegeria lacuscaerulensis]